MMPISPKQVPLLDDLKLRDAKKFKTHSPATLAFILVGASLLGSLLWGAISHAIQVLPMEQEFDPQKTKNLDIVINNTNGEERVVEITLFARSQDDKGQEVRTPSKDFFIIPRQTKILAGQPQTVKLIWQGPKELSKELAYRLIVEQLPIDLPQPPLKVEHLEKEEVSDDEAEEEQEIPESDEGGPRAATATGSSSDKAASGISIKDAKTGVIEKPKGSTKVPRTEKNAIKNPSKNQIEFLYKFVASIYARPSSAVSKIEFEVGAVNEKKQTLKLVIVNSGLAHRLLSHGKLILERDNLPLYKVALAELPMINHLNLMAGSRVNIEIPWKEKLPPTKVSFDDKDN